KSFAVGTCCKVTEHMVQRITSQTFTANEPFKPALRRIPYACTTLPRVDYNPFTILAPRSEARRTILPPNFNRKGPRVLATTYKVFAELSYGARSYDYPDRTCADIYSLSVRAPSERYDPSTRNFPRVNKFARIGVEE